MENNSKKHVYLMLSMVAVLAVPVYLYGLRPVIMTATGIVTAVVCDLICNRLFRFPRRKRDYSSIVCAMAISLMLPASAEYYVVVTAVVGGLTIAKYPFGGGSRYIFQPAALGLAIVGISFPDQVLRFPIPKTMLGLTGGAEGGQLAYASSPASILNVGGTPKTGLFDLLLGNFAGAVGATCILVLVIVMLFLCLRRVTSWQIVFSFITTVALYAALFPRVSTGRKDSILFELTSGILLFGIIFLASDPATSPKNGLGQMLYGFTLAVCTMLFRTVGSLDIEFVFVLLFMNAVAKEFDKMGDFLTDRITKHLKPSTSKAGETHD